MLKAMFRILPVVLVLGLSIFGSSCGEKLEEPFESFKTEIRGYIDGKFSYFETIVEQKLEETKRSCACTEMDTRDNKKRSEYADYLEYPDYQDDVINENVSHLERGLLAEKVFSSETRHQVELLREDMRSNLHSLWNDVNKLKIDVACLSSELDPDDGNCSTIIARQGKRQEDTDVESTMKTSTLSTSTLPTMAVVIFEPTVVETTCIEGARKCSDNAQCIDFDVGFCCECIPPYYGNGYRCLETGNLQMLNGKVSGTLNGVRFEDLDMHSFVVTKDGRTYTAISRVPAEIGPIMLTLNTIGGIIGWIFAVPSAVGALNGYSFTGGEFNRTATITYPNGESVTIRQRFYGADALDQLRMDTVVDGTVPVLTGEMAITVDDYKEEYRRVAPGQIRSRSDRTYRVNQIANRYSWDQIITYKECAHDTGRRGYDTMRLTDSRNYVVYDPNDQVVRFAMSNQIGILTGSDPCRDSAVTCGENSDCVPSDGSYRCVCRTGFSWDGIACTGCEWDLPGWFIRNWSELRIQKQYLVSNKVECLNGCKNLTTGHCDFALWMLYRRHQTCYLLSQGSENLSDLLAYRHKEQSTRSVLVPCR